MRQILIICVFMFASCIDPSKETNVPKNIIEEEKFIEVLKDLALAESALNLNITNLSGPQFDSIYNFNVYAENGVTKSEYDSTLKHYSSKPGEFKRIMEVVLERLNIEKSKR